MQMVDCRVGDVLVAINGVDVTNKSEEEVRHLIATCPLGSVHLVVFPRQTVNVSRQFTGTCMATQAITPRGGGLWATTSREKMCFCPKLSFNDVCNLCQVTAPLKFVGPTPVTPRSKNSCWLYVPAATTI